MKYLLHLTIISLVIIACGTSNSGAEEQQANTPSFKKKAGPVTTTSVLSDDIIGEWEILGFVIDTNDNLQIDEDERKNLKAPSFKDYMKLNSDGSGLFTVAKMEGRYEAKAKGNGEKKHLTWYDSANGPHRVGTIISVKKDELHIKEPGGSGLFIWKRL